MERDWKGQFMTIGNYGARLCIRLTEEEAERLRQRAAEAGQTISEYVRAKLDGGETDGAE